MVTPFALMLSMSIAGIGSAWMAGSARIPFVAGLDSYMPAWLGKVHPKYRDAIRGADCAGCGFVWFCRDQILGVGRRAGGISDDAVARGRAATGAVPLRVRGATEVCDAEFDGRRTLQPAMLLFAGISGLVTTMLGIVLAFFPARQITSHLDV